MSSRPVAVRPPTQPLVERGWKWRTCPTGVQEATFEAQGHAARGLWNLLHEWYCWGGRGRFPSWSDADDAVRLARKEIDWLAVLPAQAAQQVLAAYQQAWKQYREGTHGRPDFHSRDRTRLGFDIPQARDLNITNVSTRRRDLATVNVPLVGKVLVRTHRPLPDGARVTGARVVKEPGGAWSLVLRTKVPPRPVPMGPRPAIGLDRGTVIPLAGRTNHGTSVPWQHDPWLTTGELARLRRLEHSAARKRHARWNRSGKRSRIGMNERKVYTQIASLRARAARRRADWHEQTSRQVADTYALIGIERLLLSAMTASAAGTIDEHGVNVAQKRGLNRALLDEGLATLAKKIEYKAQEIGGHVQPVPAPYTSLRCHVCRSATLGRRESQALFECQDPACGWSGNADYNAAGNVLYDALVAGGYATTPTERGSQPASGTNAGHAPTQERDRDPKVASSQGSGKREPATNVTGEASAFRRR